jgi:hypothetical protein
VQQRASETSQAAITGKQQREQRLTSGLQKGGTTMQSRMMPFQFSPVVAL